MRPAGEKIFAGGTPGGVGDREIRLLLAVAMAKEIAPFSLT
jgi:hypothetical protein